MLTTTTNYSHQNLQGRSFKGQNLTGANFSHADIRGADFTDANLTDANFSHAQTGLTPRSKWIILLVAAGLAALAGGCIYFNLYLCTQYLTIPQEYNRFYIAIMNITVNAILWFVILRYGLQKALIFVVVTVSSIATIAAILSSIGTGASHICKKVFLQPAENLFFLLPVACCLLPKSVNFLALFKTEMLP